MYLTEETLEAQEMRLKIKDLLVSEYEPNIALAFTIIQTGGFHFDLFPYMWGAYQNKKYNLQWFDETFEDMMKAIFSENIQAYIYLEIEKKRNEWWRSQYRLFEKVDFFQMLIEDGLVTMADLQKRWETEPFYREKTCLTRFLLENKAQIDKSFFLSPDLPAHFLRTHGLDFLFDDVDENFDKLAFLKRYILPKSYQNNLYYLDLSNTGLHNLPAEVLQLEGLEALDIRGTKIRDLPHEILATVKVIKANEKTRRKIYGKVLTQNRFDYFYAQKLAYRKALMLWEGKKYAQAFPYFQIGEHIIDDHSFEDKEKKEFWENYFHNAFQVGKLEECKIILQKAMQALPYPQVLYWKSWLSYMAYFFCENTETYWLQVLEDYAQNSNPAEQKRYSALHHLGLVNLPQMGYVYDYGWRAMHEQAIYKGYIKASTQIIERARIAIPQIALHTWHWLKFFRHLQFKKAYAEIVYLFEYHENSIFFPPDSVGIATYKHHRIMWIWIEAFIQVGKLDKAELLCSYHLKLYKEYENTTSQSTYYERMSSRYFAKLAYHYLAQIYTLQNRTICAETCRQEEDQLLKLLYPQRSV